MFVQVKVQYVCLGCSTICLFRLQYNVCFRLHYNRVIMVVVQYICLGYSLKGLLSSTMCMLFRLQYNMFIKVAVHIFVQVAVQYSCLDCSTNCLFSLQCKLFVQIAVQHVVGCSLICLFRLQYNMFFSSWLLYNLLVQVAVQYVKVEVLYVCLGCSLIFLLRLQYNMSVSTWSLYNLLVQVAVQYVCFYLVAVQYVNCLQYKISVQVAVPHMVLILIKSAFSHLSTRGKLTMDVFIGTYVRNHSLREQNRPKLSTQIVRRLCFYLIILNQIIFKC